MSTGWLHLVLELPAEDEATAAFWTAALGWPGFRPPAGDAFVHHRRVGAGPPTWRLVLECLGGTGDAVETDAARFVALGGTRRPTPDDRLVVRTPGGLDVELVAARAHVRPAPLVAPSGLRSRLVQVCLDLPADLVDVEAAFWRAALGWREVAIDSPEFLGRLMPPPGSSLQVLLQQLGPDDEGRTTRLHPDLGADDLDAEVARLRSLGARHLLDGDGFVALLDPAGTAFCVTRHRPELP